MEKDCIVGGRRLASSLTEKQETKDVKTKPNSLTGMP